jgi:hypothetical protein
MTRKIFAFLYFLLMFAFNAIAQVDSTVVDTLSKRSRFYNRTELLPDTLMVVNAIDTLTPSILKMRDSLSNVAWLDSLENGYGFGVFSLSKQLNEVTGKREEVDLRDGKFLPKGELWVLAIIGFLLILFAVLKNSFGKQLNAVVQSFYSNRALTNLNKEDNLVTSWSFLLLFIQFGFTIGMFFYLLARYRNIPQAQDGFVFFIWISVAVIVLYLLKIVVLRVIGFVFDISRPVHQYISILYLSYFNTSLLFVPVIIAFALSPAKYSSVYTVIGVSALILIFVFQFIRAAVNILSQYRFPKLYLFLYFCTLEFCPILILIKVIGF